MTVRLAVLLVLILQPVPAAAQDAAPADAVPVDAYRDARARELVALARARRAVVDTRIAAYEVTVHERLSAGLAVARFERLLLRRETASRIEWSRDTVRIELLGAREVQPMTRAGVALPPATMAGMLPALAFDPTDSEMLLRVDSRLIRHPLAAGSEAHYRFASGDSSSIRLPDGRVVRLVELRIAARRADPRLINGSFWLDADTHAVVRVGFRLSAPRTATGPGISVLAPEVAAEVDHVAIDYGLWDMHWWLPRAVVARGVIRAAGVRLPLSYERSYADYRVEGDTMMASPLTDPASASPAERPCRPVYVGSISINAGSEPPPGAADSAWNEAWNLAVARAGRTGRAGDGSDGECDRPFILTRAEGVDLVASPLFAAGIYDDGEGPIDPAELRALSRLVGGIPQVPWGVAPPRVQLLPLDMMRYNRVEGFSLGTRAVVPLGPAEVRAELRAGTTGELGGRLSGIRSATAVRAELAAYRGVEATGLAAQPFSPLGSASALLLGRDESDYFRGTGAELRLSPLAARPGSWDFRLFAERQEPLRARATLSLRGLLDDAFETRDNVAAEPLDQVGAVLRVRGTLGQDPARLRTRADLELHGETGDRTFARPLLRVEADRRLGARAGAGLSLAAGTGLGDVPTQRQWQLGGATTVRGHDPATLRGESVWLARGELTWGSPALGLAAFGDVGWAGEREHVWDARPLRGAGIGVSLLDHLVRLDLARGLGAGGYHVHVRVGTGL
jgi:hypothetical protein